MRTASTRREDAQHDWYVVDAEGRTLGRLASEIAKRLRGKHKPEYTPHVDKVYYRHSGYPGGIKATPLDKMREDHPDRILGNAVRGMLPHNPLGRAMLRKLKIYAGPSHPHAAQQPKALEL